MNLMFYDFNNLGVVQEESTRNMLRSQTTDRGPSRKQSNKVNGSFRINFNL